MTDYGYVDGIKLIKVPGTTLQVGTGTLYSYTVFIEPSIEIRRRKFAVTIDSILADHRGWRRGGKAAFKRVESGANTQVILAKPDTVDKLCYPMNAVPHWEGPVSTYRRMLVNHEFGHRIGKPHAFCPGVGKIAPVMQQQTYGLQNCLENSWPLNSEL